MGAALAFAPMMAAADAPQPKSAADCRAISDFNLRGQCWDSLDKSSQQETKATKKREFGLGLRLPSVSAIVPSKADRVKEARRDEEDVKSLTLTVASVQNTPLGRLLVTSDDGAVWEQTDDSSINNAPEPGDSVKVSRGVMGGYMCQVTRWQTVRCQRDR
ncbi:MAG: hypothetical protein ACXU82_04150 [Caulobacteraceae bacterium]